MNSAIATYPNLPHPEHVSAILAPRYGYRPVWDRRGHCEQWVRCAAPALRPEYEHPRAVAGVGGRRHRKRRRAEQRVEVKAWKRNFVREMAAMPKDDLPF
jgi:hypothetical protein